MDESIKQKLYSGGLWVIGLKLLALPVGLILIALLTRMLSPEEMGVYFLASSLVDFLMLLSMLGMQVAIVRIVSQSLSLGLPGRARKAIKNVLQLGMLSSVIIAVLLVFGIGQYISGKIFNSVMMSEIIWMTAIWLILLTIRKLIAESFRGLHDIRFATLFEAFVTNLICVSILLFFFFMKIKINISTTFVIMILSCLISLIVAFIALYKCIIKFGNNGLIAKSEILLISWPLYLSAIFITGLNQGHLWILGSCSTKESVAMYGSASRIVLLFTTTLQIVRLVLPSIVAKLYSQKKYKDLEKVLRSTATIAGIPSIICLLLIIVFGKLILFHVYGKSYEIAYPVLIVLSISSIIDLMTGVPGILLMMSSKEKILLIISVVSGSLSILISLLLVNKFDYFGIAIGSGAGVVIQNLLMASYCLHKMNINTYISLKEVFLFKKNIASMVATYKQKNILSLNNVQSKA